MTPTIHKYKNFLKPSECEYFMNKHSEFFNPEKDERTFSHRNTQVITVYPFSNTHTNFTHEAKKLNGRLDSAVKKINNKGFVNYFQIVKWLENSDQKIHLDFKNHYYTSIIYLNDNFEGGATMVDNIKIKPKKGLMILFSGNKIKHGVNMIKKGERYTIPCWYTK